MRVLVDTNVLIRSVQKSHPACRPARRALAALYRQGHELFLTTQNVAEFWNVCTRPVDANGLGLSIQGADRYTARLERFFDIVPGSIPAFQLWRKLIVDHAVIGSKVHDARLVSVMGTNDIQRIVTFNVSDFTRFPGSRFSTRKTSPKRERLKLPDRWEESGMEISEGLAQREAVCRAELFLLLAQDCKMEDRELLEAFLEAAIIFGRMAIHRRSARFISFNPITMASQRKSTGFQRHG